MIPAEMGMEEYSTALGIWNTAVTFCTPTETGRSSRETCSWSRRTTRRWR